MMQLGQVCEAVNGQLIGADVPLIGISTDSRIDCSDRLFVALDGPNFNAHDFIEKAQQHGAVAALVQHKIESPLPQIIVDNTLVALGQMAAWWRRQFVLPVIGVTGSVGKTTVKEMLRSIFAKLGAGLVTHGNLNNEIGVPLTLMQLKQDDLYAVVEMGMNHAGEISRLTAMAEPTVALINNAAPVHLEGLGSVEGVAHAKGEIFAGLTEDGTAIINADDEFAPLWQKLAVKHKQLTFGLKKGADVHATYQVEGQFIVMQVTTPKEQFEVRLPALGEHNVNNALAAIATSLAANVPTNNIIDGLADYRTVGGRLNAQQVNKLLLIDDTYNASPASMRAAIDVLAQYDAEQQCLIVGDMGELGDSVEQAHIDVGQYASSKGIDLVYACGDYAEHVTKAFDGESYDFKTQDNLLNFLESSMPSVGVCLVKGSRFMHMENVVKFIYQHNIRTKESNGAITC